MHEPFAASQLSPRAQLAGKHILLSGTTGFLGKVVLSMLLDRYPEVGRVYALIRPGVSDRARDRFDKRVATSPALRPLVERYGDRLGVLLSEKVVPLDGDVTAPGCGLAPADRAALAAAGVDLVINSAGLVDFDPAVDQALAINAIGVRNVTELASELGAALVHVSTCFVAGQRSGHVLEDEPVLDQPPVGWGQGAEDFSHAREIEQLRALAAQVRQRADDPLSKAQWRTRARERLEADGRNPDDARALRSAIARERKAWLASELRRVGMERARSWGWTNTYTFTKALGEQVIAAAVARGELRASIVRPSIIESAWRYPFAGWNEGFTTTAPLILMVRQGLPHFPAARDLVLDVVPCDMVAATIIAAGAACLEGTNRLVYQAASGDRNPLTVRRALALTAFEARRQHRTSSRSGVKAIWQRMHETQPLELRGYRRMSVPRVREVAAGVRRVTNGRAVSRVAWLRQPADHVRQIADEVARQSERLAEVLELFVPFVAEHAYIFRTDNTRRMFERMAEDERASLVFAPEDIDWRQYWVDVHLPGLDQWVLPTLEEELTQRPQQPYVYRDLLELFETTTHANRHRVAGRLLTSDGVEHLTYGQLRTLARRVTGFLIEHDVPAEGRVLLVCENRPEWVAAYFGILAAGATAVPVDSGVTPPELERLTHAADASGVLLSPRVAARLGVHRRTDGGPTWWLDDVLRYRPTKSEERTPARLASLIFTSGTTGTPKGVMLTGRNFTFEVSRLGGIFDLEASDHLLSVLPLHHTFEFTAGLLLPLARGACITYLEELNAESLSRALREGVTSLIGVPALWQLLQRRIESQVRERGDLARLVLDGSRNLNDFVREHAGLNLGTLAAFPVHRALGGKLRHLVSGGSALSPETAKFFRGLGFDLTEGYGLTEAAPVLTVSDPLDHDGVGTVGKPLAGVELRIDSPDATGVGEVLARGPNIMLGYWRAQEATDAVLDEGWLRTGDLGVIDAEGRLRLVGRKKDLIVDADGRNVYPDELEEIYGASVLIKELSVVGLPYGERGERVACLLVPDYGDSDRESVRDAVLAHLRKVGETLPHHKRIKVLKIWDGELPRTSTRKVKRPDVVALLQKLTAMERAMTQVQARASDTADRRIELARQAIASLTGRTPASITPEARLAGDLGFDSLMYVELAGALEDYARDDLRSDTLMAAQTVGDVARLLASQPREPSGRASARDRSSPESDATVDEAGTYPIPNVVATLGRRFFGWGQRQLYERVLQTTIEGRAHVPHDESFIVAANHASHLDAGLIKIALGGYGRDLVSLAARDYFFGSKLRRTYFENFTNLLPIERHGAVKQSLRQALATLTGGKSLLLFPEGTRTVDGKMQPFLGSIGYLALTSGRPVLPIYLWGTFEAMPKGSTLVPQARRIGARIGPPLRPAHLARVAANVPRSEAYRRIATLVQRCVEALRDERPYQPQRLIDAMLDELRTATVAPTPASEKRAVRRPRRSRREPAEENPA